MFHFLEHGQSWNIGRIAEGLLARASYPLLAAPRNASCSTQQSYASRARSVSASNAAGRAARSARIAAADRGLSGRRVGAASTCFGDIPKGSIAPESQSATRRTMRTPSKSRSAQILIVGLARLAA